MASGMWSEFIGVTTFVKVGGTLQDGVKKVYIHIFIYTYMYLDLYIYTTIILP